jgi:hypothetical protein
LPTLAARLEAVPLESVAEVLVLVGPALDQTAADRAALTGAW